MELNKVIIAGNLTRDPELRNISSGVAVCGFGLATNRRFTRKGEDESQEETCFTDITVWGRQGEVCNEYLSKGRGVVVEGRLKFDKWQDKEGNPRSKLSIVADRVHFMSKGDQGDTPAGGRSAESSPVPSEEVPF